MKYHGSFLCCAAFTSVLSLTVISFLGISTNNRALAQAPRAAVPQKTQTTGAVDLPDAPGKDTAKRVCSSCHSAEVWAKQRHTPDQWGSIVERMVNKGAEASDEDFAQILQYLSTNLAPITPPAGIAPAPVPPVKP